VLPTLGSTFRPSGRKKFGRWGKKFGSRVIFTIWRHTGLRNKTIFVRVEKVKFFLDFLRCQSKYEEENNKLSWNTVPFWPFFPYKIGQNSGRSNFFRPFLGYAAEQSASWQHWYGKVQNAAVNFGMMRPAIKTKWPDVFAWEGRRSRRYDVKLIHTKIGLCTIIALFTADTFPN
jgi:hypothetical protein